MSFGSLLCQILLPSDGMAAREREAADRAKFQQISCRNHFGPQKLSESPCQPKHQISPCECSLSSSGLLSSFTVPGSTHIPTP